MLFEDYIIDLKNTDKIEGIINKDELLRSSIFMFNKLRKVGFNDRYIYEYDNDKMEEIMLKINPKNIASFSTYCNLMSRFLKWCMRNNHITENNYNDFININKRESYKKIKDKNIPFISYREYKQVIDDIEKIDNNATYLSALYMCLYEGIYTKRLHNLKYLRLEDIDKENNIVKLKYKDEKDNNIKISNILINKLIELGNNNKWYRNNRFGGFEVNISGLYKDSIFKIEERKERKEESSTFESTYNKKIKYINENYLGRKISAYDIFKSGIAYRVSAMAKREGVDIKKYYDDKYDKSVINNILKEELERVNFDITPDGYMRLIKDYLDMF